MAYQPQTWTNGAAGGTPITAARLTHMETGIDQAVPGHAPAPSGGDDTSALQALLDAVPSEGGAIYLRAGNYSVPNGGLTCSNPVAIHGVGAGTYESGGTRLICTSSTATLLTLGAPGSVVAGVAFVNTSATRPTAGAGLLATDFDFGRVERCLFRGWWNGAEVSGGYLYSFTNCAVLAPRNYGFYLRNDIAGQIDYGDQMVLGCTFSKYDDSTFGSTAIRWETGGGLRVTGSKVNAGPFPGYPSSDYWQYGIDAAPQAGATSVFVVAGSSIEGWKVDGIRVRGATSSTFGKISIAGNEFLSSGGIGSGYAVNLDGFNASTLNTPVISGNVAYGGCGGVKMDTVRQPVIVGNNFAQCSGDGLNMVRVSNRIISDNLIQTQIVDEDQNTTGMTAQFAGHTTQPARYAREFFQMSTNSFCGKFRPGDFSVVRAKITVMGNVQTVGSIFLQQERLFSRVQGAASNAGTVGTDITAGVGSAEVTITYDVATESGYVKPKITSATGKNFYGAVDVVVEGLVRNLSYAD